MAILYHPDFRMICSVAPFDNPTLFQGSGKIPAPAQV
jgi:hypothetical protein